MQKEQKEKKGFFRNYIRSIKGSIITGIIIVLPAAATLFLFYRLFVVIDSLIPGMVRSVLPQVPDIFFPGLGLIIFLALASITGYAARSFFVKKLLNLGHRIFNNLPFLNKVYSAIKQVLDSIMNNSKKVFHKAVLVEYPRAGSYSVGFITSEPRGEIRQKLKTELYSIFIPTTPNPTSGFLIYVPRKKVIELEMSVENALKLVVSAGVLDIRDSEELEKVIDMKNIR